MRRALLADRLGKKAAHRLGEGRPHHMLRHLTLVTDGAVTDGARMREDEETEFAMICVHAGMTDAAEAQASAVAWLMQSFMVAPPEVGR